jgi:hypothetical protein
MIKFPRGEALAATASTLLDQYRKALTLIGFAVAIVLSFAGGWNLHKPARIVHETSKPAITLKDAIVLERAPASVVPPKIVAAVKEVKGAKLERAAHITLQPKQTDCDELDLELGVIRMKDDTQRVVVRSDNAIVGGVDIPITAQSVPTAPKWSAGALYNPVERTYGAYLDRDLGPFRAGIDLMQDREHGAAVLLRVGVRF